MSGAGESVGAGRGGVVVKFPAAAEHGRLLAELRAVYFEAGAATVGEVHEDPLDLIREALPGLPEKVYWELSKELSPEAFENERVSRGEAMKAMVRAEQADALKLMLFKVWEAEKPRLTVGCLLLALGIKPMGVASGRELARMQNVSPEYVSNLMEEWQTMLGLPKTDFQKSAAAVEAARLHNRTSTKKEKEAA